MPKDSSSSSSAYKGKNVVRSVENEPQLFPNMALADDESAIERDYREIKERATNPAKQDRRVSLAEFDAMGDGNALFEDMDEESFAALCQEDPGRIYRVASNVMELARRTKAENLLLHRALATNIDERHRAVKKLTASENDMAELRDELDKRVSMVGEYKALLAETEEEAAGEIDRLETLLRDQESHHHRRAVSPSSRRALSPESRELANRKGKGPSFRTAPKESFAPTEHVSAPRESLSFAPAERIVRETSYFMDPEQLLPAKTDKATPAPPPFSGIEREYGVNDFIRLMDIKLSATTFRSHNDGLRFVLSHLKSPAFRLCAPRVPTTTGTCPHPFRNIEELLEELRKRYGRPDTEGEALAVITQLRQGPTQSFNSVYSRFLEFRSQLPVFSDAMEMNTIKNMLNESYANVLSAQAPCRTAAEMVDRLYHLDTEQKRTKFLTLKAQTPTTPRRWDRPTTSTRPNTNAAPATTAPAPRGLLPAAPAPASTVGEVPEKYRNLPPLTPEVRAQLMRDGRCMRCRERGHLQSDPVCPLAPFSRPPRSGPAIRSAEVQQGHVTGHVSELSENDDATT